MATKIHEVAVMSFCLIVAEATLEVLCTAAV